jgi:hypothetical protein
MSKKKVYRPNNWSEYNKSLVRRGDLCLWISEEVLSEWHNTDCNGQKGRPQLYSNSAILCAHQIRLLFGLGLRQTQGFLISLFGLMKVECKVPCYSVLCRRLRRLSVKIPRIKSKAPRDIVLDSTGLKVYGEGEWKVRMHGISKRRTWRKLHLGIDAQTQEVVCAVMSTNDVQDFEVFENLLTQVEEGGINRVCADGIYDVKHCYEFCHKRGIQYLTPPRKGAVFSKLEHLTQRNAALQSIQEKGLLNWKLGSGYSRRSLAETGMFRFKQTFSDKLKGRLIQSQAKEAFIKCTMLNRFAQMGMPRSKAS